MKNTTKLKGLSLLLPFIISFQANAEINKNIELHCQTTGDKGYRQVLDRANIREVTLNVGGFSQVEHDKMSQDFSNYLMNRLVNSGMSRNCAKILTESGYARLEEKGDGTLIARLYFDFNKTALKPHAKQVLKMVFNRLQQSDKLISVEGNTDSIGTSQYNLTLGMRRSDAVIQHLLMLGALRSDFKPITYGESRPIASNKTDEGRELNRRVDVRL